MRVAIVGQGYVGLTIAVSAAAAGHRVVGFDINENLVTALNSGTSHIEGVSSKALASLLSKGTYSASTDVAVLEGSEVIVIAVPTPLDKNLNCPLPPKTKALEKLTSPPVPIVSRVTPSVWNSKPRAVPPPLPLFVPIIALAAEGALSVRRS